MSDDHNRGAYTPQSDAPLAFDARHSRGPGERPLPLTLIVSGIVLLILVIGGIIFVMRGASGDPAAPVTGQPIEAMKTTEPGVQVQEAKPVEQQGLQIGYAEGQPLPQTGNDPTFTAQPEAPGVRPPAGAPPAAAPTTVINPPLPSAPPAALPAAKAPVAQPVPKVEPKLASAEPKPVAPAPKPAPTPAPKAATGGAPSVQIGAFSSANLAEQSWNSVATKVPGRIAGKTLRVEKADVDGRTYHRALVGGFASKADADNFCAALKAQGGDCSVRN